MTRPGSKLISYIRVSALGDRDQTSESTQTITQQREANEAIAKLSQATIVDEVQALNASGGKTWPEPKLAEAIARVDAGEADGIIVYDLSRWGRHLKALEVVERWADEGKVFLSASDKFDATTPSGRMSLRMMMVVARYYWEETRDRLAKAQRRAHERGAHIARTPFGYLRVTDERDPRVGCLDVDPAWAPVVREAFRLAADGDLRAAMDYLNERVPQQRWRTDDVRRLLANRSYLGEVRLGANVKRGAHAPLVTPDVWRAAQTAPRARRRNSDYPLSGVATCAECGAGLTGQLQTVRGRTYRRYRCSNPACGGGSSINADKLENHVRGEVKAKLGRRAFRRLFEVGGLEEANEAVERAEADLEALVDKIPPSHPAFDAWNAKLEGALEAAVAHRDELSVRATLSERLPAADEVDDDRKLLVAIRAGVVSIRVARGRGAVDARAPVVFVGDLDDGAGALAA